ncbi:hypothetical protein ACEPPN_013347 [Leptodophora sp. 'Broadleaf-Isolate-01']
MAFFTMDDSSCQRKDSRQHTIPRLLTPSTVKSLESLDKASLAPCILDIPIPKEQSCCVYPALRQIKNTRPEKQASNTKYSFNCVENDRPNRLASESNLPFKHAENVHKNKLESQFKPPLEHVENPIQDKELLKSKHPFDLEQSHYSSNKKPISLSEHTFDQIEHLADVAKRAALTQNPNVLDHIDDIADCATDLAIDLLETQVDIERVKKQYEVDHTRVEHAVLALRSSRTKLEGERDRIQDLVTRMNGIKFDYMTALARYQVQKAEYEHRAQESQKLRRTYKQAVAELEATKEERERELVMMATQMWNLKLMVGDMFVRSEWTLRDGMVKAAEEIDFTLQRLETVMNASVQAEKRNKELHDPASESASGEKILGWGLVTKEGQDSLQEPQSDPELVAWNDMDEYTAGCGSCATDDEDGPKVVALSGKDIRVQEDPYWHEGEYRFWNC